MQIFSSICAVGAIACLIALVIKYPLRKLELHKANAFFMKLHEAASAGFFLFSLLHMAEELLSRKKSPVKKATGAASLALSIWLITDCHMARNKKKKMVRHRWYSLFLVIGIVLHALHRKEIRKSENL